MKNELSARLKWIFWVPPVIGFLLVLFSSFLFCFQNVIVRVLFNHQSILGLFETGGFVVPALQNSFLLMFMRMLLGVPLMALLAPSVYPPIWHDLGSLRRLENRRLLAQSLFCGFLMYLYLALLYISIGLIPTGIALTLFFTYPVFTALLSWRWFGHAPSGFRWLIMLAILLGSFLTMPSTQSSHSYSLTGVIMGVASGVAYAGYTVVAQKSFEQLHPIPFSWISFTTTLFLSGVSLLIWPLPNLQLAWLPLWIGGLLSAIVTFSGHIFNNFGIRQVGATAAAMIGASNPALTVVLAWLVIQETLNGVQLSGVALVTLSVALLSLERRSVR